METNRSNFKSTNLLRFLFFNFTVGILTIFIPIGLLSLVGIVPVVINGESHIGLIGCVFICIVGVLTGTLLTLFFWFFTIIGLFIRKQIKRIRI